MVNFAANRTNSPLRTRRRGGGWQLVREEGRDYLLVGHDGRYPKTLESLFGAHWLKPATSDKRPPMIVVLAERGISVATLREEADVLNANADAERFWVHVTHEHLFAEFVLEEMGPEPIKKVG